LQILEFKSPEDIAKLDRERMTPLMMVDAQKKLLIVTDESNLKPVVGTKLICLVLK
jgi:hypothetical protein